MDRTLRQKRHYDNFDSDFSEDYDERWTGSKYEDFLVQARLNDIIKDRTRTSLDLGCGTGVCTGEIAARSDMAVGADLSLSFLTKARDKHPAAHFVCADAQHLPFKDGTFDMVYCYNTFYHIDDWRKAVSEASRLLKKGGSFRFEIYNIMHPFVAARNIMNLFVKKKALTYGTFLASLKRQIARVGLMLDDATVVSRIEATETVRKEVPASLFKVLYKHKDTKSRLVPWMRMMVHCSKITSS